MAETRLFKDQQTHHTWQILSDTAWEKIDNLLMQALKTQAILANDIPKGLITAANNMASLHTIHNYSTAIGRPYVTF